MFDYTTWKLAAVEVIRTEAHKLGLCIHQVFKASTGTWYVRICEAPDGRLVAAVRLSDHRSRAVTASNRRLLNIVFKAPGRLRDVPAFLRWTSQLP